MASNNGNRQDWFGKKDRIAMWQTLLPGLSTAEVDALTRFAFNGAGGTVDGREAHLITTQMEHNNAIIMLQAKLTVGDQFVSITAFNTDSSNNQPHSGQFFRLHNIEIGRAENGKETEETVYKAPPPIGKSVTKLFNAAGLRREITPLQMEATATVLSHVLRQFRAGAKVRMVDIAPLFEPESLEKLPPVTSWRIYAGRLASIKRASQRRKAGRNQGQTP